VSVSHIAESGLILLFGHPCVTGLVVEVDYSCIQTFSNCFCCSSRCWWKFLCIFVHIPCLKTEIALSRGCPVVNASQDSYGSNDLHVHIDSKLFSKLFLDFFHVSIFVSWT
jgi:hypothetical protein